jgi:hypothetical protein
MMSKRIDELKSAILRVRAWIEKLEDSVSDVCPCCQASALGGYGKNSLYGRLLEKQERQLRWLCVLLKKRGTPEDIDLIRTINNNNGPG